MPRLTSHGEVVFEQSSQGRTVHGYWGDYRNYWPGQANPAPQQQGGCGVCGQNQQPPAPPVFQSIDEWFERVQALPSDFHEHMATVRDLAAKAEVVVELSRWLKPSCLALAAGKPKQFVSICPGPKPEWPQIQQLLKDVTDFKGVLNESLQADLIDCDLLFIDTWHRASVLMPELERWAPHCRGHIVIHCTQTFGENGDDGTAGVLPALRHFVREHPEWSVIDHYENNNGLVVLSCLDEDKPSLPSTARQVWNFAKAMAKYKLSGLQVLNEEQVEARLDVCALCKSRVEERCSKCGCPLIEGAAGAPGKAFVPTETCPYGLWREVPRPETH